PKGVARRLVGRERLPSRALDQCELPRVDEERGLSSHERAVHGPAIAPYCGLMKNIARRFWAQHVSLSSRHSGRSSPYDTTVNRADATPCATRKFIADRARRSPSARLYSFVPRSSQCPCTSTIWPGLSRSQRALASRMLASSGRMSALSNSKWIIRSASFGPNSAGAGRGTGAAAGSGRAGSAAAGAVATGGGAGWAGAGRGEGDVVTGHPGLRPVPVAHRKAHVIARGEMHRVALPLSPLLRRRAADHPYRDAHENADEGDDTDGRSPFDDTSYLSAVKGIVV